ncbi:RHS repeat-associated core domain-containing protein [Streptomyces pseudogriseolus]|uniref:RHS repeat-associated core domain-containing protein n=1 Tax=Streptomyces pseudogriseolus TaxID=36817 RepID=UPI00348DC578
MTEGTAQTGYLYDANGELLIRRASGDGDTILYFGNTEVRLTVKGTTKTVSGTRYYTANGQTIAVRTAVSGTSGTKLSFLAADHHGTSNVAIDAGTFAPTKRFTTPFGAPRGPQQYGPWPDDKGFLGKPRDTNTGLTHIGARAYDPETGQFISVDPLLELDKHQTLNGYSYAAQNPLTHSDPTGMGLACGNGPTADGCPKRPDGRAGNGRPNEAAKGPFGKHPCNSHCGTAASDSNGQTIYSAGTGEVLACAYGHCVGNVGPSDTEQYIGNYLASILSDGNFWSGIIETAGGAFGVAGGGVLAASGVVECATGVLCVAGAPSIAAGTGIAAAGGGMLNSGSDKLGRAFREADAASEGSEPSIGKVPYGSTSLGKSVALQRLIDKKLTGGNYAAGRLEDGTILVGRSNKAMHAEEDIIQQAGGKRIVDIYSEREPCKNKCMKLTTGMNRTYTVPWNGVDRDAANAALKKAQRAFFDSM